jgi:DNA-binding NtrC family response regulator
MEPVILIALVDETLRNTYGLFFAEQGYRVLTASGRQECVHKVQWMEPEVLVVDEELWIGMNGAQAKSHDSKVNWPCVVLITSENSDRRPKPQSAPVVACLKKPVDIARLLEEVTDARGNSLYTSGKVAQEPAMPSGVGVPSRL